MEKQENNDRNDVDYEDIHDLIDAAAKGYPLKALAVDINKNAATMRGELTMQPGAKLGLKTFLDIIETTGDLRSLDKIEEKFGRIAYAIPTAEAGELQPILETFGKISKEFGEKAQAVGEAVSDGDLSVDECDTLLKENRDIIAACLDAEAVIKAYRKEAVRARRAKSLNGKKKGK